MQNKRNVFPEFPEDPRRKTTKWLFLATWTLAQLQRWLFERRTGTKIPHLAK